MKSSPSGRPCTTGTSLIRVGYFIDQKEDHSCGSLSFDAPCNWIFYAALHGQRRAALEKAFIDACIKEWLLAEGKRSGSSAKTLGWAVLES